MIEHEGKLGLYEILFGYCGENARKRGKLKSIEMEWKAEIKQKIHITHTHTQQQKKKKISKKRVNSKQWIESNWL